MGAAATARRKYARSSAVRSGVFSSIADRPRVSRSLTAGGKAGSFGTTGLGGDGCNVSKLIAATLTTSAAAMIHGSNATSGRRRAGAFELGGGACVGVAKR